MVIWITGLSGAGKTTVARVLLPKIPQPRVLLDGDEMRSALELVASGYERENRLMLALTYSRLCGLLAAQGVNVVCSTISFFHAVHAWNREHLPGYFEVFLDVPESVRLARDAGKKVYAGKNIMGIHIEPEYPLCPDLILTHDDGSAEEMAAKIVRALGFS